MSSPVIQRDIPWREWLCIFPTQHNISSSASSAQLLFTWHWDESVFPTFELKYNTGTAKGRKDGEGISFGGSLASALQTSRRNKELPVHYGTEDGPSIYSYLLSQYFPLNAFNRNGSTFCKELTKDISPHAFILDIVTTSPRPKCDEALVAGRQA